MIRLIRTLSFEFSDPISDQSRPVPNQSSYLVTVLLKEVYIRPNFICLFKLHANYTHKTGLNLFAIQRTPTDRLSNLVDIITFSHVAKFLYLLTTLSYLMSLGTGTLKNTAECRMSASPSPCCDRTYLSSPSRSPFPFHFTHTTATTACRNDELHDIVQHSVTTRPRHT